MSDRVEKNEVELEENQAKTKLKNFNFAAFIMPHIWGIGNGVYRGLLALIPILYELNVQFTNVRITYVDKEVIE